MFQSLPFNWGPFKKSDYPKSYIVTFLNNKTHCETRIPVHCFGGFADARKRAWENLGSELHLFPEDFPRGTKISDYSLLYVSNGKNAKA